MKAFPSGRDSKIVGISEIAANSLGFGNCAIKKKSKYSMCSKQKGIILLSLSNSNIY